MQPKDFLDAVEHWARLNGTTVAITNGHPLQVVANFLGETFDRIRALEEADAWHRAQILTLVQEVGELRRGLNDVEREVYGRGAGL